MNIELIKQTTFEDYQRRLNDILDDAVALEKEEYGLYKRILNTDRQLLYGCIGKIVHVSQSSVLTNRDELTFFETLSSLFHYYMYDDGELSIHWHKYKDGDFVECDKNDKFAKPFLTFFTYVDEQSEQSVAREKDIHWLIDWHENAEIKRSEAYNKLKFNGEIYHEKEYINYNDPVNEPVNDLVNEIIGKNETESRTIANHNGYDYRVTRSDNVSYVVTCDFRTDRINVEMTDGLVTKAYFG